MEIHGGGQTLFNREVTVGALPETPPVVNTDGHSMLLEARRGGGVIPPYVLVIADIVGGVTPTVTLDAYLHFPYARYLSKWQLIKRTVVSDDYSLAVTFMLIPTMGATRIAVSLQSATGSPTTVRLHARAINDDQAFQLLEIQGGGGGSVPLSDLPPMDVTTSPAYAGLASEASRQDHKHSIVFPAATTRRFDQLLVPTANPNIFTAPAVYIHGGYNTESVFYNGQRLLEGTGNDYLATESGGGGTGYDTVITTFAPRPSSSWTMDFVPA